MKGLKQLRADKKGVMDGQRGQGWVAPVALFVLWDVCLSITMLC